jgi:hypothetical protein
MGKTLLQTLFASCERAESMTAIPALTQNRQASPAVLVSGQCSALADTDEKRSA